VEIIKDHLRCNIRELYNVPVSRAVTKVKRKENEKKRKEEKRKRGKKKENRQHEYE
jgi:hypothetical protein